MLKIPKHRQYGYIPRYWDPEKEELEMRMKELKGLDNEGDEGMKARISSGFRTGYHSDPSTRKRLVRKSNMMLIGIIFILIIVGCILLDVYLPGLMALFEGNHVF